MPPHIVWFQPIVAAASGRLLAAEALARTHAADGRVVSAGTFFANATASEAQRLRLDRQTIREVGAHVRAWIAAGFEPVVNVNVSTQTIATHVDCVIDWLAEERLDPRGLTIEITETAPVDDIDNLAEAVDVLRRAGLRIAIDDFGCGSATFELLYRVGGDVLKIDRRFVAPFTTSERSHRFIAAIVRLAHELGMHVVAEGVESVPHWDRLAEIGCDAVQGHAIAHPMSADAFARWRPPLNWNPIAMSRSSSL